MFVKNAKTNRSFENEVSRGDKFELKFDYETKKRQRVDEPVPAPVRLARVQMPAAELARLLRESAIDFTAKCGMLAAKLEGGTLSEENDADITLVDSISNFEVTEELREALNYCFE